MSLASRRALTWLALVAVLGGFAACAAAAELEGRVVAIRDGDTIDLLTLETRRPLQTHVSLEEARRCARKATRVSCPLLAGA